MLIKSKKKMFVYIIFVSMFVQIIICVMNVSLKSIFDIYISPKMLAVTSPYVACASGYSFEKKSYMNATIEIFKRDDGLKVINNYAQETFNINKLEELIRVENESKIEKEAVSQNPISEQVSVSNLFVPESKPVALYSEEQLKREDFIKEAFFIEDPTTEIREGQLDYSTLSGYKMELQQSSNKPQILVYHTHSQEKYADSDENTTIVGVGEYLCELLRKNYDFNVIHHKGEYDVESRDYAYSNAMIGLEHVLEENPSIEVMIDLHRDEMSQDTKLVTTIQGIQMAKIMFFNGLCYTRELGELTSLPNPYVQDNLAFSFQMQLASEQYYPGLTRKIYLKGYRYNLHYRPKSLLIELGAQNNTVEEAMNACEPLAHVLSLVLGKKE